MKKAPKKQAATPTRSRQTKPAQSQKQLPVFTDLLSRLDYFFEKNKKWLFWIIMFTTLMCSALLFDIKVSLTGDDSFYVIRAHEFIHSFKYPSFQGPLYPMALSLLVAIFGIKLLPLKLFSMAAMLAAIYLFYRVLEKRIPPTILIISLVLISINSYILYYASQTYSEAFYMFMQMLAVGAFIRYFIDTPNDGFNRKNYIAHLIVGAALLALTLTRSVGFSAIFAVAAYFGLKKQWKNLLLSILTFVILLLVFQGFKHLIWSSEGWQFSAQGSGLMNKDYYNPQDGKEDLVGLLVRWYKNSNIYLSKHFLCIIGLRTFGPSMTLYPFITLIMYGLAVAGLYFGFRKNNYVLFTGLLAGAFLMVTFVVLQAKWDQSRLIIPASPFMILLVFSAIYYFLKDKKYKPFQFIVPLLAGILFLGILAASGKAISKNQQEHGIYGGLTPDWSNYLKASEWASDNLPKDAKVACRKPSMSFIYGKGREFFGIMQLPTYHTDKFINNWKRNKNYIAYDYSTFANKTFSQLLVAQLKENLNALAFSGNKFYYIESAPDSLLYAIVRQSQVEGLQPITDVNSILPPSGNKTEPLLIYYPDSLLYNLQKNKVTHILTANIRRNSFVKDGNIVNTVERYAAFINEKYPDAFTKVVQIGDNENEPATIFQINYGRGGK